MNTFGQDKSIMLITDGGALRGAHRLFDVISEALYAGQGLIDSVLLREQVVSDEYKPATDEELLELAKVLRPICAAQNARLIINRRGDLAVASAADGVHLGKDSLSIAEAKQHWPELSIFGYSAHTPEEAAQALRGEASYVSLAPIYSPFSKPDSRTPLGILALRQLRGMIEQEGLSGKVYALGGINAHNAVDCLNAGADGVAVLSAILLSSNPRIAAEEFHRRWARKV